MLYCNEIKKPNAWRLDYVSETQGRRIPSGMERLSGTSAADYPRSQTGGQNGDDPAFARIARGALGSLKEMAIESRRNVIVGEFRNAEGGYAYMIVNFSDPVFGGENEAKIKFNGMKTISLTDKGSTVKFSEEDISLMLQPGDGIFITVSDAE